MNRFESEVVHSPVTPFMNRFSQPGSVPLMAVFSFLLSAGCTTERYRKSADKEAYGVVAQKTPMVKNMDEHFTIEQTNQLSFAGLPVAVKVEESLGADGELERGAHVISLEEALGIGIKHNRDYQLHKEQLYLTSLGLTLARHQFTPIFSGNGNALIAGQTEPPSSGGTNALVTDNLNWNANGTINVSWLIRDVGRITTAFTADFLHFLTGNLAGSARSTSSSHVNATLLRPLLRNAGFQQEIETLTQAERGLLYALRDFVQFRKSFSVQVASAYYGVLGSRDAVRNSFLNLQSSRKNAERTRALAREGRVTQSDLGRLEQQELQAERDWINAIRDYKRSLDDFKLAQLGIPVDTNLILDDKELGALEIQHPQISVDDSIKVALAARQDYQNFKDRFDDSVRRVALAANFLKPQLDLSALVRIDSRQETAARFAVPDVNRYNWNAGLDLDPGLDRKTERNAYRTALIFEKQAARSLDQQEDELKLQVRNSWRTLDQAKRNYEISEVGVKIAERRVEEQNLLAELGRAKAQDQVDAQNDLINSKNQRTQALVGHTIARLQFWVNMGILHIKANGRWEEVTNVKPE